MLFHGVAREPGRQLAATRKPVRRGVGNRPNVTFFWENGSFVGGVADSVGPKPGVGDPGGRRPCPFFASNLSLARRFTLYQPQMNFIARDCRFPRYSCLLAFATR